MIEVHRSDTGHFVLTHPATDTVVVSEDLAAGYARIEPALRRDPAPAPPARPSGPARWPWLLVALLPFVWLAVLHASLGRLVGELAVKLREPAEPAATRRELEELRLDLARLEAQLAASAPAPARAPAPAPEPPEGEDEPEAREQPPPEPAPKDSKAPAPGKRPADAADLKNPFAPKQR